MSYLSEHGKFISKYRFKFSIDAYLDFRKSVKSLDVFTLDSEQTDDAMHVYADTLTAALESYLKSRTEPEAGKDYDLSDLAIGDFIEDFEKVMCERQPEGLTDEAPSPRKPFEGMKRSSLVNLLRHRMQHYDQPLSDVWADAILSRDIPADRLESITRESIEGVGNPPASALDAQRMKHLAVVVMLHRAMEKVTRTRGISWRLWPGNWAFASREGRLMRSLDEKMAEYTRNNYPIDRVASENNKNVLENASENLQGFVDKPYERIGSAMESSRLSVRIPTGQEPFGGRPVIEAQKPEKDPAVKHLPDNDLFLKIG